MRSIACNIYKLKYQHINREEYLLSNLVLTIIRSAHLVFVCHGINYQVPPGVPPNASVARINEPLVQKESIASEVVRETLGDTGCMFWHYFHLFNLDCYR